MLMFRNGTSTLKSHFATSIGQQSSEFPNESYEEGHRGGANGGMRMAGLDNVFMYEV